jgi:hypothetical protein
MTIPSRPRAPQVREHSAGMGDSLSIMPAKKYFTEDERRAAHRRKSLEWKANNNEQQADYQRARMARIYSDPAAHEALKQKRRDYSGRPEVKEKRSQYNSRSYAENPTPSKARALIHSRKKVAILSSSYVAQILRLDRKNCPEALIEAKREHLRAKRTMKEVSKNA